MKLQDYPAVEPLWPLGRVAQFYVKHLEDGSDIGIRELVVSSVTRIDGGWIVRAVLPNHIYDTKNRDFVFEVDEDGESAECVPWDSILELEAHMPGYSFGSYAAMSESTVEGLLLPPDAISVTRIGEPHLVDLETIADEDRNTRPRTSEDPEPLVHSSTKDGGS